MPMKFRLSSPFGAMEEVRGGDPHTGIDLAMPEGTQLRSVVEGVVERVVDYGTQNIGKGVIIRGENGTRFIYGHMREVTVHKGEAVLVGDPIGLSGNTGNSTGPHLHFGMHRHGEYIDPTPLADSVASLSGGSRPWLRDPLGSLSGKIGEEVHTAIEHARDEAVAALKEHMLEFLQAAGEVLLELSYGITLVGTALLIILRVAGLKDGYRWAGLLFTANAIVRLLLGVGAR